MLEKKQANQEDTQNTLTRQTSGSRYARREKKSHMRFTISALSQSKGEDDPMRKITFSGQMQNNGKGGAGGDERHQLPRLSKKTDLPENQKVLRTKFVLRRKRTEER